MMRNTEKIGEKGNRNHQNSENTTKVYTFTFIKLYSSDSRNMSD